MNATEAAEFMSRLQAGESLRTIMGGFRQRPLCSRKQFLKHCELHPEWGEKAIALAKANSKARIQQGVRKRVAARTHCDRGHELTPENTSLVVISRNGWNHRECKICRREWNKRGRFTAEQVDAVEAIVKAGGTLADATASKSSGGVIKFNGLAAAFREQPKLAARLKRLSKKNADKKRLKASRVRWAKVRARALADRAAARDAERAAKRNRQHLPKASWETRYKLVAERTGKLTSFCRCCEKELPLASFYPSLREGVTRTCRPCTDAITSDRIVFTMNATEADHFISRLEAGDTLRLILGAKGAICSQKAFQKHCALHPDWAAKVRTLSARNAAAAAIRKGDRRRLSRRTHCENGHALTPDNIGFKKTVGRFYCKMCQAVAQVRGNRIKRDKLEEVKRALLSGMSLGEITSSKGDRRQIVTFKALKRERLDNPDFNQFIVDNANARTRQGLLRCDSLITKHSLMITRPSIIRTERRSNDIPVYIPQSGDYEWFYSLTPRYLSEDDRFDVVSNIYVALQERRVRREDVPTRIQEFTKEHTKLFPNREDGKKKTPLSLNKPIFLDGKATLIDEITTPLWSADSIYYER